MSDPEIPTPRTDDVWVDVDQFSHDERQQRRRDLSRQLERELAEMTQEMLRIAALNAQHVGELSQAKRDAERPIPEELVSRIFSVFSITDYPMNRKIMRELIQSAALAKREGEGS